ncbi:nucleoredoxin-like protein 2 isoform X1 [Balaenoptera acutorostrata]|uniref:Nucleoredoxin-like protein 2 isoform X1 n=1 Tax=Balaenoptera acutorostrata TaxID=9767 RepID=A0ABM3TRX5_BALAC|nr:nucleoredoxin-like protein 2 isoform X1 [Balaenoptera acutorostrata]XP_057404835.1 nucleoredoxin-like protein 2 isoform X1 [Balaenoptera acutorostrata]XP_057404836.1 nucleoredoxin-like protein 2 isoform X1 [Balaenoptera acutorostrata]XP_057404837.1 nucleoredoxin-like protein 2 isoform X1 [Balaenoptera acutorostrata]
MVDVLGGRRLVTYDGTWVEAEAALQNKVLALYFAAGRCAPSRDFTPLLCDFYAELVDQARPSAPFEVVFVSADGSAQEMLDFMRELHGAWLALPFHDPYRQSSGDADAAVQEARSGKAQPGDAPSYSAGKKPPLIWRAEEGDPERPFSELRTRYHIVAIPRLVIVKPSGDVITDKGRKQIRERGLACFQNWVEAADIFQNFSG